MTEDQYNRLGNGKLIQDDIVVCIRGSLGKHGKYPFTKGAIASSLVILRSIISASSISDYIMMWLDAPIFFAEIKKYDNGTAQPNLAAKSLEQFFVPLPPLAEQQRIVAKIEELMPFVDRYDKLEKQLQALNTTFPDQLKKSILQYAIQGKLVHQDPTDEPASALLERIRAEKEQLIKDGKIKREKNPSHIFRGEDGHFYERVGNNEPVCIDDQLPFEIPESWEWAKLQELATKIGSGSTPTGGRTVYVTSGIKFIRSQNVYNDGLHLNDIAYIPDEINAKKPNSIVQAKDILLNITGGSIGRCAIVPDDFDNANINQHVMIIRQIDPALRFWIHSVLISNYIQDLIMDVQVGVSREGLSATKIKAFFIPIPPLAEQYRIVEKLKQLDVFIHQLTKL